MPLKQSQLLASCRYLKLGFKTFTDSLCLARLFKHSERRIANREQLLPLLK